jgi:hypothetical protein
MQIGDWREAARIGEAGLKSKFAYASAKKKLLSPTKSIGY